MSTRRAFLQQGATGAALFGTMALPLALRPSPAAAAPAAPPNDSPATQDGWNLSWPSRITGKYKALFDVAEVESGFGVWRAAAWAGQYAQLMNVTAAQLSPVIVLRHNAIILAMQQSFWDKYGVGKAKGVMHPLTGQPLDQNPVLLDEKDGIPAPFTNAGLHKQLASGVVVLACNLALGAFILPFIKDKDKLGDDAAHRAAVEALVPGVILQPSGVFAATRAQEAGCTYIRSA